MKAIDPDIAANAIITYSILARDPNVYSTFRINAETGEIHTSKVLDREVTGLYHMTVIAKDRAIGQTR